MLRGFGLQCRNLMSLQNHYNFARPGVFTFVNAHSPIHSTIRRTSFSVLPACKQILILSSPFGTVG